MISPSDSSGKKRILIFSTAYAPFVGGAEIAVKEITDRLPGYEFVMITAKMRGDLPRKEQIGNVKVHRIGIGIPMFDKLFLALFGHRKALKLHKKKKVDLVWSIMASYSGFAASSFKKKTGVPFLLTLQEGDPIEYILKKVRFIRKRFGKIFTSADGLQVISTFLKEWGEEMGFRGKVVEIIPNGVDAEKFKVQSSKFKEKLHAKLNIQEDKKIIITVSRLVPKNGMEYLIRAMEDMSDSTHLAIVGDGELRKHLEGVTAALHLEKRVHFLGIVPYEALPEFLAGSDVFCRPSLSEGLGNAFLEAMAAGVPVVGTRVGGIQDFLEDSVTGFVCAPQDSSSTANAINSVFGLDADELARITDRAERMVRERFTWDSVAQNMNTIFLSL